MARAVHREQGLRPSQHLGRGFEFCLGYGYFYNRFINILSSVIIWSTNRNPQTLSTATWYTRCKWNTLVLMSQWIVSKIGCIRENKRRCVIAGFSCSVNKVCNLLGFYAAQNGSLLPTFRDNISVPSARVKDQDYLNLGDWTDRLSRNVTKELPFYAA